MTDTPEAAASMNVRFASTLGFDYMLTVRSFAEDKPGGELLGLIPDIEKKLQNLGCKPIFGKNSGKAAEKSKAEEKEKHWCDIHDCEMPEWTSKDGKRKWRSHKIDGTDDWCKGGD